LILAGFSPLIENRTFMPAQQFENSPRLLETTPTRFYRDMSRQLALRSMRQTTTNGSGGNWY